MERKFFKNLFSTRNNLTPANDVILVGEITPAVRNSIINCYDEMWKDMSMVTKSPTPWVKEIQQVDVEREIWVHYLDRKQSEFCTDYQFSPFLTCFIDDLHIAWFIVLNVVEYTIKYIQYKVETDNLTESKRILQKFIDQLNFEFERLDYGYRIIDTQIVEITSKVEIDTINEALNESKDNVREHLKKALELYSLKPQPDVRNSIKESISAVEAVCREITSDGTLGEALKHLEKNGVIIHDTLKSSFTKLYVYTNDEKSGIRHALMDATGKYVPSKDEAYLMIVTCSAFINYIRKLISKKP